MSVNVVIIGSGNILLPGQHQAIIWTNAGILLIGPLGTNFSIILAKIITFSFKKMYLKVLSAKWRPFCLGLNVLRLHFIMKIIMHLLMYGLDILHIISRNTFQIPNKISYPYTERYDFAQSCNFKNSQI